MEANPKAPQKRKKEKVISEADPKKGTGKKPKGSGRRHYTDENPDDTVPVKFRTVQDIKDTLSRSDFKSKSHARQSQIINLIHQRVRAAYQNAKNPDTKKRLKKAFDYAKKRKEASKKKTEKMRKESVKISKEKLKEIIKEEIELVLANEELEELILEGKYDHIDFKPPEGVAKAAARGLELRKKAPKSKKGGLTAKQASKEGIGSGVQRAVNLKNRNNLSPATVKRMKAFFDRHQKSRKIDPGKTAAEDKGYQAWMLWGGDAGYSWAKKVVRQMEAADKKSKK